MFVTFSTLYYSIFPLLGKVLGALARFASMSYAEFYNFIIGQSSLSYQNLFDGSLIVYHAPPEAFAYVFKSLFGPVTLVFTWLDITSLPLWAALISFVLSYWLLIVGFMSFYRWLKDIGGLFLRFF